MKYSIKVTGLGHEDLVTILSTGLTYCSYLECEYPKYVYDNIPKEERIGDCWEDHMADVLLHGGFLKITDLYADGELYTKRKHSFPPNLDQEGNGIYAITLSDILWACSSREGFKLLTETLDGDGDYSTANNLIQIATFGEIIYG